jgi:type I restriction enzyme S subunit
MGATVGKTYAYKNGNQIYAGYLIRYKLNLERITPEYLFAYTRLKEYWDWVLLNQSGAAQPGINAKKYGSLQVPVPPLNEQRAFQEFVNQIDKSKVVVQKALDEAQLLFDILMQKYFG